MTRDLAEIFTHALQNTEQTRQADDLISLFSEDCQLMNHALEHKGEAMKGLEGARRFWSDYLSMFREIRSEFSNTLIAGDTIVLEWVSHGTLRTGEDFRYSGVSLLEPAGEKVKSFRAYYDSAAIQPHVRAA